MICAGTHRARAVKWGLNQAKSGNVQIGIVFNLLDLPGQTITYYGSLTDNALGHTVKALRNCGWQHVDLDNLEGLDANEVLLVVEHEQYNGKLSPKVKWVNSVNGIAMANCLGGDELRGFSAAMRGKIAAISPASIKRTSQAANNSDIPF